MEKWEALSIVLQSKNQDEESLIKTKELRACGHDFLFFLFLSFYLFIFHLFLLVGG